MFYSPFSLMKIQDGALLLGIVAHLAINTLAVRSKSTQEISSSAQLTTLVVMDTQCYHSMDLNKACFIQTMM